VQEAKKVRKLERSVDRIGKQDARRKEKILGVKEYEI
jgi:hypothetical protein